MLTETFAPELSYLFEAIPKERQTCLFTATWTESIDKIADAPPKPGKQRPFVHKITARYVHFAFESMSLTVLRNTASRQ